jgi:hypothetical protein
LYDLPDDYYETYLEKINSVTVDDVQNAAIEYFRGDKARIIVTGKAVEVLKNLEANPLYKINYYDKYGKPSEKPEMSLPIPDGVTASTVVDNYIKAIGGADKVTSVNTLKMTYDATIQGTPIVLTTKVAAPNKEAFSISVQGQVFQKRAFNGETGYDVARGQKSDMSADDLAKAKVKTNPFPDMAYRTAKLDRIEMFEGKQTYVIKTTDSEIFYDVASGLKVQTIRISKGADGKETRNPVLFSDYKEVNGILFPHKRDQITPQFTLNFVLKETKINEGVEDKDFE